MRDLEQVKEWVEAAPAEGKPVVAGAREAVLRQTRAVIASDPTVIKEQPINWELFSGSKGIYGWSLSEDN